MNKVCKISLLFLTVFLGVSCVKEVNFSGTYEKKVTVNCILNYTYYEHHDPYQPGMTGESQHLGIVGKPYSTSDITQQLFLSYNKQDGEYEDIQDAEALLFDDRTGMLIGRFEHWYDNAWKLEYPIPCTEDETSINVDVKYRLEVSVPGMKKIVSRTSFCRRIPKSAIVPKELPEKGWLQTENLDSPAWLIPYTYEVITQKHNPDPNTGSTSNSYQPAWLYNVQNSYPRDKADPFNISNDKGGNIMAIRLNGNRFDRQELPCGFLFPGVVEIKNREHFYYSYFVVASVSEEYDKYLKSAIVDAIHHHNKDDVFTHLNEDQVYSNIENGVGIFGVQFTACLSNDLRPVVYSYKQ